ncbi:MAG: hypothetical protein AABX32_02690 [Nanoarchaeota archaeon]
MKNILLDTNIYGLDLERKDVAQSFVILAEDKQKPERKYFVLGSEVVYDEINAIPHKETREKIRELYQAVISGEIRLTDNVKSLALEYFNQCKKNRARITIEDCQIMASASLANVGFIVSDNRNTLRGPKAVESFASVNKKGGLKMPSLIGHEALKSLLLGSGVS